MLTGLLFSRAFCQPSRVMAGTMEPMDGTNWTVGTCICSHWLCGPLVCYWILCGRHGCSWSVPRGGFCHLPPSPPTPPHPTPPRCPYHPPPLLSILMAERDGKKYLEIQPSEAEKVSYNRNQWITKYFAAQHISTIQG